MKSLAKIIAKIFLSIIIFCNLFFVFDVNFSYAADKNLNEKCIPGSDKCNKGQCLQTGFETYQCILFVPQVEIEGVPFVQPQNDTKALGEYIKGLYNYFIGITGIVATVILMIGGFQWMSAGGNSSKVEEAKNWIFGAISGLALALGSYAILSLISPNLVNFEVRKIPLIGEIKQNVDSCCAPDGSAVNTVTTIDIKTKRETISCPTGSTSCEKYCAGKTEGTKCNSNGFCYKGQCLIGDGNVGEPCGAGLVGVCSDTCITTVVLALGGNWILSNPSKYIFGRNCGDGLWCCAW